MNFQVVQGPHDQYLLRAITVTPEQCALAIAFAAKCGLQILDNGLTSGIFQAHCPQQVYQTLNEAYHGENTSD